MEHTETKKPKTVHMGNNLKRIREMMGMKQDVMGLATRSKYSQQTVSKWENAEAIPDSILEEFSPVLGVSVEFIKNFNEQTAVYNIQNIHDIKDNAIGANETNYQPTINNQVPDKLFELFERFIEEDKTKTQAILDLGKMVADLAKEIKDLKEGK